MKNKFISTIITSGPLAPIDSMESELKYNFDYKLENTHVIDDSQFNFCVLSSSPDKDIEFNFNKDNRTNENMILEYDKNFTFKSIDIPLTNENVDLYLTFRQEFGYEGAGNGFFGTARTRSDEETDTERL